MFEVGSLSVDIGQSSLPAFSTTVPTLLVVIDETSSKNSMCIPAGSEGEVADDEANRLNSTSSLRGDGKISFRPPIDNILASKDGDLFEVVQTANCRDEIRSDIDGKPFGGGGGMGLKHEVGCGMTKQLSWKTVSSTCGECRSD